MKINPIQLRVDARGILEQCVDQVGTINPHTVTMRRPQEEHLRINLKLLRRRVGTRNPHGSEADLAEETGTWHLGPTGGPGRNNHPSHSNSTKVAT